MSPPDSRSSRAIQSGTRLTVNFCRRCGTSLYYSLERFPDRIALFGGTFDDPSWFDRTPGKCQHIFTRSAQEGTLLPADVDLYEAHRMTSDGKPAEPTVLAAPQLVSRSSGLRRAG